MKTLLLLFLPLWLNAQMLFTGPQVCEYDTYNPFSGYRMDVVWTLGGDSIVVPGFFAADGDAANTSAKCGDQWAAYFNPSTAGAWTYHVLFSRGVNAAINGHTADTLPPHGQTGVVVLQAGEKLEYVGQRYRRWRTGEYFLKFGTDSPETLLAYSDFDGTYIQAGGESLLDYESHVQDWTTGDPTWQGVGQGIIGALNYLAAEQQNAISFVLMNINGDGRNCWPFVSHDTLNRYDVSKLAQWRIVLAHAGDLGIHWQAKFGEMENNALLTDPQWKLMYRELVARFSDLPALTWNLGEEFIFTGFAQQVVARANYLREVDPYPNLIVFHNLTVLATIFNNFTVRDLIDGASLQIGQLTWTDSVVAEVYEYNNDTTFVISNDEQGPSDWGTPTDFDVLPQTQEQVRQLNQYPVMFGGCEGWEAYYGYETGCTDLLCDDFRTRAEVWRTNRGLREVLTQIPWWNSTPLYIVDTSYCFGSEELLVYSHVGDVELDVVGDYSVRYFDVLNQTWSLSTPFTGVLSAAYEYVAHIVPSTILSLCITHFELQTASNCNVHLRWAADFTPVLEESQGQGWYKIEIGQKTTYIDVTPSKFYRLRCGDDVQIAINYDWCPASYWITGNTLVVNDGGRYEIIAVDGRVVVDRQLPAGHHLRLSTGAWIIVYNNRSKVIIIP